MCADAPDNSGVNAAALANAELSRETMDFYREIYAEQTPAREAAAKLATEVANQQMASSKQNDAIAKDYWDYQKNTFRPLEQGIVADAEAYDTAARRESEAGTAVADVGMQAQLAREAQTRQQQRMGVNPNSGVAVSMQSALSLGEAAAKAGAAGAARKNVETIGVARKMDAASLGRGLPSAQATSASVALQGGNNAVANAAAPLQQASAGAGLVGQGAQIAGNLNSSAGQMYGQASNAQSQANATNAGTLGTLGTIAGTALMFMSDENKKEGIKPVTDEEALAAVEKTPVSSWKYKAGEGDGGQHVGPMAQHVRKSMGDKAAPGGKVVDLITMNGVTMAGVAALSRKVDKLSKKLEGASA